MSRHSNKGTVWDKPQPNKQNKVNPYDFENNLAQIENDDSKPLNVNDVANAVNNMVDLKVSEICLLKDLKSMSSMNGKKVRIIGPYNECQQRYPVFVYDTKDVVLIKSSNLCVVNAKDEILAILQMSNATKHENVVKIFANKLMKSNYNQLNTNLMDDFRKILEGNCIYIPYFLCKTSDYRLLHHLKNDIKSNQENGMIDWSKHLKHENPSFSFAFNMILSHISSYFDMEIFASRLNYYRNGKDWKPYHHDSHAYLKEKNVKEDFTIGVSFGYERILSFKHVKTEQIFNIPQRNGDCFAFNGIVNRKYQHAILKGHKSNTERFSIIAWGKRRTLNHRNSGVNERKNHKTFTKRQIL